MTALEGALMAVTCALVLAAMYLALAITDELVDEEEDAA